MPITVRYPAPETSDLTRAEEALRLADRPLIVCDVDDVVLQFVTPFKAFLEHQGHRLVPRSFRRHGNIVRALDEAPLEDAVVTSLIVGFYAAQETWQTPFVGVVEALQRLSADADLVFLTAMPPRHAEARRRLLDRFELRYPLIAADEPKGPLVHRLHQERTLPLAFIDDMSHNLHSVGSHIPHCRLIHLPRPVDIHALAPPAAAPARRASDWEEAEAMIRAHFSL